MTEHVKGAIFLISGEYKCIKQCVQCSIRFAFPLALLVSRQCSRPVKATGAKSGREREEEREREIKELTVTQVEAQ